MILDTMKAPVFPVSLFLQAIKNYVYFELFLFGISKWIIVWLNISSFDSFINKSA